jgi:hypothetical protein
MAKVTLVAFGTLTLAVPAVAQQGGQQPPRQQGAQQPPPGPAPQGAQPGGQGGPPRQGGGGGGFGGPPAPPNTGVPLNATMVGFAEVPGPGDGAGSGRVTVVVDPPKGRLCYMFFGVTTSAAPTAAHIHTGAAGASGGPVVTLQAPASGSSSGCQEITADLAQALVRNPAGYYVNVHSAQFPQGAIRGQLSG